MRIGIDARFFGPSGKGLGRYTEKLIKNLEEIDSQNEYVIFLRKENWKEFEPRRPKFKKVLADYPWYGLSEQFLLPRVLRRANLDLMHFPHFNVPIFYNRPFIVTIHDLILLQFPTKRATTLSPFLYKIKYTGYKNVIWRAVQNAKKVITVSEYTKKELINYFKIAPEKIVVTYEAADIVESGQLALPDDASLEKRKITKPFLLYVGNAYPHKNLETLLDVFERLKRTRGENFNFQLVLVGKEDYFYKRLKTKAIGMGLVHNASVVFFGFATQKELAHLYRRAKIYIFPSLVEGFGLPGLEAMSYGLPVVASKTSCLPEVLGDAAEYFDPKEASDIERVLARLLANLDRQKELKKLGLERVKQFNWQKMAKETKSVYGSLR